MVYTFPTNTFTQPVVATTPEPNHALADVLPFSRFLALLREEEEYYPGQQHNTRLMITCLRKIFYDQWGWNSELIRGSAAIPNRYQVLIVDDPATSPVPVGHGKAIRRYSNNVNQPKERVVTYRADDRQYGTQVGQGSTRVGKVPEIYQKDHQEVLLPDGTYCDVAHVLAGLDAANHPQIVSPLPGFLSFLDKLAPHVDANIDIVTWLGDIASSSGDFLFRYLSTNRQALSLEQEQLFINRDAPGSDMLGDIDAYVIGKHYPVSATQGQRITDILADYYEPDRPGNSYRQHRYSTFCAAVGLTGWDGVRFANEPAWLRYYHRQLRDNVSFQVFSLTEENLKGAWLSLGVWLNGHRDVLKLDSLLRVFLDALKELIKSEPPT